MDTAEICSAVDREKTTESKEVVNKKSLISSFEEAVSRFDDV
jgi:hypothetical protein